jgi:hypothetical protein
MSMMTQKVDKSGQVDIARERVHADSRKGALIPQFSHSGSTSSDTKYLGKLTIVSIHDARECQVDMSTCPPLSTSGPRISNSEGMTR